MKTHWVEFFRIAIMARPRGAAAIVGPQAVVVGGAVMLSLPEGHPIGMSSEAIEWLQEQENAS